MTVMMMTSNSSFLLNIVIISNKWQTSRPAWTKNNKSNLIVQRDKSSRTSYRVLITKVKYSSSYKSVSSCDLFIIRLENIAKKSWNFSETKHFSKWQSKQPATSWSSIIWKKLKKETEKIRRKCGLWSKTVSMMWQTTCKIIRVDLMWSLSMLVKIARKISTTLGIRQMQWESWRLWKLANLLRLEPKLWKLVKVIYDNSF